MVKRLKGGDYANESDIMVGLEPVLKHLGYDVDINFIEDED